MNSVDPLPSRMLRDPLKHDRSVLPLALRLALLALFAAPVLAHAPHDTAFFVVVSPDFATDRTVLAYVVLTDHPYLARSTDAGRSWLIYSHPMLSHGLSSLAFSPDYAADATVFASTKGGVYKSIDGGMHWTLSSDGLFDPGVRTVALSPDYARDATVLAVTSSGCFRSVDAGATWALSNVGLVTTDLAVLTTYVANGEFFALAGSKVLHRSTDGGVTWTPLFMFPKTIRSVSVDPSDVGGATIAVCFGRFGDAVKVSVNGGSSFTPMLDGLTEVNVNAVQFAKDGTLFAATKSVGVFRAPGPLQPWVELPDGLEPLSDQASEHYVDLAVSPTFDVDGYVFVAAFEGLFSSQTAGSPWVQTDIYNQRLNRRVAFSPAYAGAAGQLWAGNYGGGPTHYALPTAATPSMVDGASLGGSGVLADAGPSGGPSSPYPGGSPSGGGKLPSPWSGHCNGLQFAYTDVIALAPDYPTSGELFYGYVGFFRSLDRGLHWTKLDIPAEIFRACGLSPGYASDRTMFVGTSEGGFRSTDGGDSFTLMQGGLPATHKASMIVVSPDFVADRTLYISSREVGVHRSSDGGDTWQELRGLPNEEAVFLTVSPGFAADHTLHAGMHGGGIWVSADRGETWAASNGGLPDGEPLIVEGLALSPAFQTDRTMFVSLRDQGVYRSTDAGATWQPSGAGLPLDATRVVEVSPAFATDRTVLLSTHGWLYMSRDAGESWQRLPGYARADEKLQSVQKSAGWTQVGSAGNHGPGVDTTSTPAAWQEFTFLGDSVAFLANLGPQQGNVRVELDGAVVAQLSLAAPVKVVQQHVWKRSFDDVAWHTVRIVNAGGTPQNPNTIINSDGFEQTY